MKVRSSYYDTKKCEPTELFLTINWTCDNKQGRCMLIDVAIPGDRNVIKTEAK
jgi:hypothetical protein